MDRDIIYIYDIVQNSQNRLTTSNISREILSKYNVKVSKKIIQNDLWSFLRHEIDYMLEKYTYLLKDKFSNFKIDDLLKVLEYLYLNGLNNKYDLVKTLIRL